MRYAHSTDHMNFNTAASERMRIDSSGNVLIGKTAQAFASKGVEFLQVQVNQDLQVEC
jgi:hypothetical protein